MQATATSISISSAASRGMLPNILGWGVSGVGTCGTSSKICSPIAVFGTASGGMLSYILRGYIILSTYLATRKPLTQKKSKFSADSKKHSRGGRLTRWELPGPTAMLVPRYPSPALPEGACLPMSWVATYCLPNKWEDDWERPEPTAAGSQEGKRTKPVRACWTSSSANIGSSVSIPSTTCRGLFTRVLTNLVVVSSGSCKYTSHFGYNKRSRSTLQLFGCSLRVRVTWRNHQVSRRRTKKRSNRPRNKKQRTSSCYVVSEFYTGSEGGGWAS